MLRTPLSAPKDRQKYRLRTYAVAQHCIVADDAAAAASAQIGHVRASRVLYVYLSIQYACITTTTMSRSRFMMMMMII